MVGLMTRGRCDTIGAEAVFSSLDSVDIRAVAGLLVELPLLYPGGALWLKERLNDSIRGDARCTIARLNDQVVGATIETPKPNSRMKLSTIYVAPSARGLGIGTRLFGLAKSRWKGGGTRESYVTVPHHRVEQLERLLLPAGFTPTAREANRYGAGRHEVVYTWLG
jgi:GNAT superfamily N-acetyltransferase